MDEIVGRTKTKPPEAKPPGDDIKVALPPRRRGRRWWKILLVGLAIFAGVVIWQRIENMSQTSAGRARNGTPPQAIRTATATIGDIPIVLNELGTVTSLATVTVRTQIAGQLQQIGFTEGQMVKAGDFLAQVDPRPYQVALEQAQGQLAKDQATLAQAQSDFARYQLLNKQDSISKQQVTDQEFLVHQSQGAIAVDQAQVDSAKLNLAYCHIVSPVTGRVGLRQVDQGNYVQVTDTNGIVVVTQIEPISVIFTIPEDNAPQVMSRLKAGAKLPVTAFDRSNTTQLATGMLDALDNQIDTTTGTVKLRAMFPNTDDLLFPNQFVNARLLVDTLSGAVVVPNAAIQLGAPGSFVYVVKSDDTVAATVVKTGPTDGDRTAILSGLAAGDVVVIDGTDRLRDGARVLVRNGDQTTAPSSGQPPPNAPQDGKPGHHRAHDHHRQNPDASAQ
jgi:multidrug efflux system membrane fusion protein